jgi:DNA-directed RNA polymerase subunit omega
MVNTTSRNSSDEAAAQVGGRFNLVLIAAARVRELKRGHQPKVAKAGGPSATALAEIAAGKIGIDYLKRVKSNR